MKYFKWYAVALLALVLPLSVKAYDYVNSKNKSGVERDRKEVYDLYKFYEEMFPTIEDDDNSNISSSSCSAFSDLTITPTSCDGSVEYGKISLEDYVKGVYLAEEDDTHNSKVFLSAWMVIIKSFTLGKNGYKKNSKVTNLKIRSCTADQEWCHFEKGCYYDSSTQAYGASSLRPCDSGNCNYRKTPSKKHYSQSQLDLFEESVEETKNKVASTDNGKSVQSLYYYTAGVRSPFNGFDADVSSMPNLISSSSNYIELLKKTYPSLKDGTGKIVEWKSSSSKSCSVSNDSNSGAFENWKQCDSRWGNISLGGSTICSIGCAATSVSIQIARSGTKLNVKSFNPGVFVNKLKSAGGFTSGGGIYWDKASVVAPNFKFVGSKWVSGSKAAKEMSSLIKKGYYIIAGVNVSGGEPGHWVAIKEVKNNKIYMYDPAAQTTNFSSKYGSQSTFDLRYYKKTD